MSALVIQTLSVFEVDLILDFVQFGILSIWVFVQFGILSFRDFVHSILCPIRNSVQFGILSVGILSFGNLFRIRKTTTQLFSRTEMLAFFFICFYTVFIRLCSIFFNFRCKSIYRRVRFVFSSKL